MWFITHKVNTQNTHLTSKTPSSLYLVFLSLSVSFIIPCQICSLVIVLCLKSLKKLDKNLHLTEEKNQALAKICNSGIGNSGECLWAPALLNTVSETASAIKNMFHSNESWLNYQRWLKIALYILNVNINYCRFLLFFFTWEYKITSIKLL